MNPNNYQGMGVPQMGMQMAQTPMGMNQPHMSQPQMAQPSQIGHPQLGKPQMAHMGQTQMVNMTSQQQQIISYLRAQKIPMGWQQTYRIEHRLAFIFQMYVNAASCVSENYWSAANIAFRVTQLALLRADSPTNPLNIAIEFEKKQFEHSPDQVRFPYVAL